MLRTFRDHTPAVHPSCYVAPTAVISGQVSLGAGSVVLDGAVVTAESAPVNIGEESVIMENAVVRGAGAHPVVIGDRTLVGPGAHVTGAVIGQCCMIATHGSVFNGARLSDGVLVAIGAIVHVGTFLAEGSRVPMQHIAVGDPATIYPPERAAEAHQAVEEIGFTQLVFGHDTSGLSFAEAMSWLCGTYSHSLRKHQAGGAMQT